MAQRGDGPGSRRKHVVASTVGRSTHRVACHSSRPPSDTVACSGLGGTGDEPTLVFEGQTSLEPCSEATDLLDDGIDVGPSRPQIREAGS